MTPQGTLYTLKTRLVVKGNEYKSLFQIVLVIPKDFGQRSIYMVTYMLNIGQDLFTLDSKSKNIYQ